MLSLNQSADDILDEYESEFDDSTHFTCTITEQKCVLEEASIFLSGFSTKNRKKYGGR